MSEPNLLQRQHKILQSFREVTTRRREAEAEAEARYQTEFETAENTYAQTRKQINKLHNKASFARERLEHGPYSIGLNEPDRDTIVSQLFHEAQPAPTSALPGADPMVELKNATSRAQAASWRLTDTMREWWRWQDEQAIQRRGLWLTGVILVIVITSLLVWIIL